MFKITKVGMLYIFSSIIFVIFQMFINQNPVKQEIQEFSQDIDLEANYNLEEWKIEIPKIGLYANIAEGTTNEILNQYVGHFDTTSKEYGNIPGGHNIRTGGKYCEKDRFAVGNGRIVLYGVSNDSMGG